MRKITFEQLKRLVREGNRYLDDFVPLDSVRDWIENGDEETFNLDDDDGDYEYIDSVMAIRRKHHDQVQVKGNVPKGFNAKRCPKCGGMGIYYIDSDAMGHEVWGHIECAKCGAHASEELEGPDEDRPKDEVIGILVDRWNSGELDDGGKVEYEVKEEVVSKESSYTSADALIDQIYRMIEAGDAERARALLNRNRKAIAKSYPGALRELESLINDNL